MACLLQPKCNFLHGFFRCKLLVEVMDVEVKVTFCTGDTYFQEGGDDSVNQVHTLGAQDFAHTPKL